MKRNLLPFILLPMFLWGFIVLSCTKEQIPVAGDSDPEYPLAVEQNMDSDMLEQAVWLAGNNNDIKCLLVGRNGVTVMEEYFNDADRNTLHEVRSVTKSITSILIGIAIDKGIITSVHSTLNELTTNGAYEEKYTSRIDQNEGQISIHHFLTMSSGIDWAPINDWTEYVQWRNVADQILYVLDKNLAHAPGEVWNYSDGASHLLSWILTVESGIDLFEFAMDNLFEPLDIDQWEWTTDNQGYNLGCVGLSLKARDLMKIGNLFLQEGFAEDEQLVSENWVRASVQSYKQTGIPWGTDYGYLWWLNRIDDHDAFFANGYGGQFILVVPDLNLVVVATCEWMGVGDQRAGENWMTIMNIIENLIVPSAH